MVRPDLKVKLTSFSIKRPVTNLAWDLEKGNQFVSSFSGDYQFNHIESAYIWDVESPNTPLLALQSAHPAPCIEYNPKDYHILASGINSGQVVIWDTRVSGEEQLVSNHEVSHRDQINALIWFTSKTNSEFFSGSNEGQILWWAIWSFTPQWAIIEFYIAHIPTIPVFILGGTFGSLTNQQIRFSLILSKVMSVNWIELMPFQPSTVIPVLRRSTWQEQSTECCSLATGRENQLQKGSLPRSELIFYGSSLLTSLISSKVKCHYGAICSVTRSPHFIKNYMTVGDWQAKIWTEDNKDTSIVWTKEYFAQLTCGVWSETRCAVFFIGRTVTYWEFLVISSWFQVELMESLMSGISFKILTNRFTASKFPIIPFWVWNITKKDAFWSLERAMVTFICRSSATTWF